MWKWKETGHREGGLCKAAVLLKQISLGLELNFMTNQVITCLSLLLLVWPRQELQKLNLQETAPLPSQQKKKARGENSFQTFLLPEMAYREVRWKPGHAQWREWSCRARAGDQREQRAAAAVPQTRWNCWELQPEQCLSLELTDLKYLLTQVDRIFIMRYEKCKLYDTFKIYMLYLVSSFPAHRTFKQSGSYLTNIVECIQLIKAWQILVKGL